jgi:CubicO group peptidase (beta-lactamase class C family)
MKGYRLFMALLWMYLLLPACKESNPDEGNYKYGVSSWQGTYVFTDRYKGAIEKSRNLVMEANRHSGLPGAQLAVAIDGKVCWSENFGFSNLEAGTPVKHNTIFRLASTSKLFTASAVGKLVEEGKLDLDLPVTHYLPHLPEAYSQITTRHLVSHQSGIRHYYGADKSEKTEHYADVNEALPLFVNAPLLFHPGENSEYSSYGWLLVSAIIQQVSGKPFLEYMHHAIWQPLGLKNTFGEIPPNRVNEVTRFYIKNAPQASWEEAPYQDLSYNWGGSGLSSNANDLVLFGNALLSNQLLSEETMQLICTPQLTSRKDTTGFGIGFILYNTADGERIIGHGGFMPTAKSYLLLFPESNLVIAFTSNTAMVNFGDETLVEIAHLFIEEKKDENHFVFNRTLHQHWTGLWQIETENEDGAYEPIYLHFYEYANELKGTILTKDNRPAEAQITSLKKDSIQLIAPFLSHTVTLQLARKEETLSGKSEYNKPLHYALKKQLIQEQQINSVLLAKKLRNGKKLN